jgi:cell division protease FtsH
VHKVTIIPRGRALGVTMQLPEQDRYSQDRDRLLNTIAVLFGGRIAEEIFMHQMTTGASNDFERATDIARRMVTQWGMSDALGPWSMARTRARSSSAARSPPTRTFPKSTMQKVDAEIRRIIDQQYGRARRKLLEDNRDKVEAMTAGPARVGTIDADQINDIMAGKPPREPKPATPPASTRGRQLAGRGAQRSRAGVKASQPVAGSGTDPAFFVSWPPDLTQNFHCGRSA